MRSDTPPNEPPLWEAVYTLPDGRAVSGGEFEDEAAAARAADALARAYGGDSITPTNFPPDPYAAWLPPAEALAAADIPTLPGVPLTPAELAAALEAERGGDVRVVSLAGRSDLADALVFATGRTPAHMRRMADTVARALRRRRLVGLAAEPGVENRGGDDWMVVDCGNVIVCIMDAAARRALDLERFYEGMTLGKGALGYECLHLLYWRSARTPRALLAFLAP